MNNMIVKLIAIGIFEITENCSSIKTPIQRYIIETINGIYKMRKVNLFNTEQSSFFETPSFMDWLQ